VIYCREIEHNGEFMIRKTGLAILFFCAVFCTLHAEEDHLAKGLEWFLANEYSMTDSEFKHARKQYAGDAGKQEFLDFAEALNSLHRTDVNRKAEATAALNKLKVSKSPYAPWAAFELARYDQVSQTDVTVNFKKTRELYQYVIDHFPGTEAAFDAFIYQQQTYIFDGTPEELQKMRETLREFIRENPDHPETILCYKLLFFAARKLGDYKGMVAANKEIAAYYEEKDPETDNSTTYWGIANVSAFRLGDLNTAIEYMQRFVDQYPEDPRNYGGILLLQKWKETREKLRAEIAKEKQP